MKFSPIIYLIGMLLCILSLFMMIPAIVDWFYGNNDWPSFVGSSLATLFVGAILFLSNRDKNLVSSFQVIFLQLTTLLSLSKQGRNLFIRSFNDKILDRNIHRIQNILLSLSPFTSAIIKLSAIFFIKDLCCRFFFLCVFLPVFCLSIYSSVFLYFHIC